MKIDALKTMLVENEDWLMERILFYAKQQKYTIYTSTLLEAWRISISGISASICQAVDSLAGRMIEFSPHDSFADNPIAQFALSQARSHRKRGTSLEMFLGLLKYYRQSYLDLVVHLTNDDKINARYSGFVIRCFDLFEITLCSEWNRLPQDQVIGDLQKTNQELVNEKNRYLTMFESLSDPALLLDEYNHIHNLNLAAGNLLGQSSEPGEIYYGKNESADPDKNLNGFIGQPVVKAFPWLSDFIQKITIQKPAHEREEVCALIQEEQKYFHVSFSAMMDVSRKYRGGILVFSDITKIRKLASIDALTGANNRRRFMELAENEFKRAVRYNLPLAVLMIDIDHFKRINDTHGHPVGDRALYLLTRTCLDTLRESDIFGRIGGEEFAVVLAQTGLDESFVIAERLRRKINEIVFIKKGALIRFTVSIGVAASPGLKSKLKDLLGHADHALYKAKNSGRNRVVSADF